MVTRGGPKYGWLEKRLNTHLLETGDYGVTFDKNRDLLIELASQASEQSPHYDGVTRFGVVGVALGATNSGLLYLKLGIGNNGSRVPRAKKSCAEMGLDALFGWYWQKADGNSVVMSAVIWGPSDPVRIAEITGTSEYEQCLPCHDCIGRMAINKAFTEQTEITSANEIGSITYPLGHIASIMSNVQRPLSSVESATA